MMPTGPELTLQTIGPLIVVAAGGLDCTPRGRKARGMLALLALAPDHRRSRTWLQDKLWSDRSQDQGAASLRQTLSEIRRAFGQFRDCLRADRDMVTLDPQRVECVHRSLASGFTTDQAILFENLDVSDPEFEDWLRDQRNLFDSKAAQHAADSSANCNPPRILDDPAEGRRLQLVITQVTATPVPSRERVVADSLIDMIARTVGEMSEVDVIDLRQANVSRRPTSEATSVTRNTLAIRADVGEDASGMTCRVAVMSPSDNRLLWTTSFDSQQGTLDVKNPAILRDLNQLVEEIYRNFLVNAVDTEEKRVASLLCRQAIQMLLRLRKDDMMVADVLFEKAYELQPRGIYLAWRAYLRTYLLVEFIPPDRQTISDEAIAFMRRALELEPNNSYVASLSAHVHAIVRQSYVAAFELAERSVQINPANPIGWACLGIAECNLGRVKIGFEHTLLARELAGSTPFRFFINALSCIAGSTAGEIDKAILLGEAAHGLQPAFKPPLRFLSALYLLRGRHAESQTMVDRLKVTEPNFSYELLRDKSYPASSLHHSKLLEKLPQRQI